MNKSLLILILVPVTIHPAAPSKTRACLKIGYGFAAVIAGIGCPFMGAYHTIAGKVLAGIDNKADQLKEQIKDTVRKRPLFQKLNEKFLSKGLLSFAQKADQAVDLGIDSQVKLQQISGYYYFTNTFLLIPFGIAAIRSGLKDLKNAVSPSSKEDLAHNKIASDKGTKS